MSTSDATGGGGESGSPPEKRPGWLRRHWKWMVAGVVGLIIGAAAGAGGESTSTSTTTVASVTTHTETQTQTQEPTTVTETVTEAGTATAPPTQEAGGGEKFSGNGGKNLGTITVSKPSTLKWTNDGDLFQLFDADFKLSVNSQAHSGDTAVDPGTYNRVEVNAIGNWTIQITPTG